MEEEPASLATGVARRRGADDGLRDQTLLQLARVFYGRAQDPAAVFYYGSVPRGSAAWLTALFEASWSHFRQGDDERALGNLLTLHAPFFQGLAEPESYVLQAFIYYRNCRYDDAREVLARFEAEETPVRAALEKLIAERREPLSAYELVRDFQKSGVDPRAIPVVTRALEMADAASTLPSIAEAEREIDLLEGRNVVTQDVEETVRDLRERRTTLIERVGTAARTALVSEARVLGDLLSQTLRIRFESTGREKEALEKDGDASVATRSAPRARALREDEVEWPYEGEYWRDELGTYEYLLTRGCR